MDRCVNGLERTIQRWTCCALARRVLSAGIALIVVASFSFVTAVQGWASERQSQETVWQSLGQHMHFAEAQQHPIIEQEIRWLADHPAYLRRVTQRSEPYIYYIWQRVHEAGLPAELALLPIVESAYDPFAYSPGRAAGLWQFIPSTAKHFGLQQSWWYDGRRDIVAATDAAIEYLDSLNVRFDDWLLALASYNAGQARVARAIRRNQDKNLPVDYWSLKLPDETMRYVPRLLAVAKVLQDPERYGIAIHPVDNQPQIEIVDAGAQIDLAQAARLADIDMDTLYRLNPGYNRWATPPKGPHQLLLPTQSASSFKQALAQLPEQDRIQWNRYKVISGDTLSGIAQRFGANAKQIAEVNQLRGSNIRSGQALMVPVASQASSHYVLSADQRQVRRLQQPSKASSIATQHQVVAGESWWTIARKHQVSYKSLARWNGKAPGDLLRPGDKLIVWKNNRGGVGQREQVTRKIAYRVRSGDNLSSIAEKFSVGVNELVAWNKIDSASYLYPGDKLKIHVAVVGGAN